MRIGIGYDIHRLIDDRKLILCGIEIPYVKGLVGYSDGDVVTHAVSDAMLGALAMGDIGQHFPDTDPKYKNIPSRKILEETVKLLAAKGYRVNNVDTMIIAEEPKIYPFREKMVEWLAAALGVEKDSVSIKATTNEGVGSLGKGEAIAAYAVVTIESSHITR